MALSKLDELTPATLNVVVAVTVAAGMLYCFLGYRALKFVIGLTGFILVGSVGGAIAGWLTQGQPLFMAIGTLLGGAAGAVALLVLYKVGVFCLGMLGALLISVNALYDRPEPWAPWAMLALGIGGGLVVLVVERPILILATAAIGSWMVVMGIAFFVAGPPLVAGLESLGWRGQQDVVVVVGWVVLALVGALAQFTSSKRRPPIVVMQGPKE